MNKKQYIIFLLLFIAINVFAASPMDGWHWDYPGITLKGENFISVAKSYDEQEGYAVINGIGIKFYLYDTITYHNGNAKNIYDTYVPRWIEKNGYAIDFDNIEVENPSDIPNSIKALMKQRDCDTAVSEMLLSNDAQGVIIIEYLNSKKVYKETFYPIIRITR